MDRWFPFYCSFNEEPMSRPGCSYTRATVIPHPVPPIWPSLASCRFRKRKKYTRWRNVVFYSDSAYNASQAAWSTMTGGQLPLQMGIDGTSAETDANLTQWSMNDASLLSDIGGPSRNLRKGGWFTHPWFFIRWIISPVVPRAGPFPGGSVVRVIKGDGPSSRFFSSPLPCLGGQKP